MLFDRKNAQQKSWRKRKIAGVLVSVCSLFVIGGFVPKLYLGANFNSSVVYAHGDDDDHDHGDEHEHEEEETDLEKLKESLKKEIPTYTILTKEQKDALVQKVSEADSLDKVKMALKEGITLESWQGVWNNFGAFTDNPAVEKTFKDIDAENKVQEFIAHYEVGFDVMEFEGHNIKFYDKLKEKGGKVISNGEYEFEKAHAITHGNYKTHLYEFKSKTDDVKYPVVILVEVHGAVGSVHYHFQVGNTSKEALKAKMGTFGKSDNKIDGIVNSVISKYGAPERVKKQAKDKLKENKNLSSEELAKFEKEIDSAKNRDTILKILKDAKELNEKNANIGEGIVTPKAPITDDNKQNEKSDEKKFDFYQENGKTFLKDEKGNLIKDDWAKKNDRWYFFENDGSLSTSKWIFKNGSWFWSYKDGVIAENEWVLVNGKWYFAKSGGYITINQWHRINEKWYHFDKSGALSVNKVVDGYRVNAHGEWVR